MGSRKRKQIADRARQRRAKRQQGNAGWKRQAREEQRRQRREEDELLLQRQQQRVKMAREQRQEEERRQETVARMLRYYAEHPEEDQEGPGEEEATPWRMSRGMRRQIAVQLARADRLNDDTMRAADLAYLRLRERAIRRGDNYPPDAREVALAVLARP